MDVVVGGRKVPPDRFNGEPVNLTKLSERDERATLHPKIRLVCLLVNPLGRFCVPLDLKVFTQFLLAHGAALVKESLDLLENQSVSLDCGRVVRFLVPDALPNSLVLVRSRETPNVGEFFCRSV